MFPLNLIRIIIFISLSCATLSFATPVQNSQLGALSQAVKPDVVSRIDHSSALLGRSVTDLQHIPDARAASVKSCPEIYKGATSDIEVVVADLKVALGLVIVDKVVVIAKLNAIIAILTRVIVDVKLLVGAELSVILTLDGVLYTVHDLAVLIFGLLNLLLGVISVVVKALIFADVAVSGLVVSIGALVSELLTVTLSIVVGLKVELAVVIQPLITIIVGISGFGQILVLLGISI